MAVVMKTARPDTEATCGHVDCHMPFSECQGHSCDKFYRAPMNCADLDAFLLKWVRFHSARVVEIMAAEGIEWAERQHAANIKEDDGSSS